MLVLYKYLGLWLWLRLKCFTIALTSNHHNDLVCLGRMQNRKKISKLPLFWMKAIWVLQTLLLAIWIKTNIFFCFYMDEFDKNRNALMSNHHIDLVYKGSMQEHKKILVNSVCFEWKSLRIFQTLLLAIYLSLPTKPFQNLMC